MIIPIKQGDARWKNVRIGRSATTLRRDGCTISSMCMLLEKLRGYFCNPKDAAYFWKFNYKGEILWKDTEFKGMKFKKRGYGYNNSEIASYVNSDNRGAILEVNNRQHWVYVEKVEGTGLRDMEIIDPIDGKRYDRLPLKYNPTGYALFERDEIYIPEWMDEVFKKAKAKGLEEDDPLTPVNLEKLAYTLFDLSIIDKKPEGNQIYTLGWFLMVMEKIKSRW